MTIVKSGFQLPVPIADGGTSATTALGARTALGITIGARDVDGTTNQIVITNSDGSTGNPTVSIASNPVLPGSESVTVPHGTTAEQPISPTLGMFRGNDDTNQIEYYSNGVWNSLPPSGGTYTPHAWSQSAWVDVINGVDALTNSIELPNLTFQYAVDNNSGDLLLFGNSIDSGTPDLTTTGTGDQLFLQAPATMFNNFTTIAGDPTYVNTWAIANLVTGADNGVFYADQQLSTVSNSGSGNYYNSRAISSLTNIGYAELDCGFVNITNTGGYITATANGINNSSVIATNSSTTFLSSLSSASVDLSTGSIAYVLSASPLSYTNDGTGKLQGFAGSTIYGAATLDGVSFITATVNATASATDLAGGGVVNIIVNAPPGNANYRIVDMYLNYGGINFDGGGDRDIAITNTLTNWTVIPALALQTLPGNLRWGDINMPFPLSQGISAETVLGANFLIRYSGGTTDYVNGSITITVIYARIS